MSPKLSLNLASLLSTLLLTSQLSLAINPAVLPHPTQPTPNEPPLALPHLATDSGPTPTGLPNLATTTPAIKTPIAPATTLPSPSLVKTDAPLTATPVKTLNNKKASKHHPLESFRIDLTAGQSQLPKKGRHAKPTKAPQAGAPAHCPPCPACPKTEIELIADTTAMGAVIIQDPANGINGRSYQALVVLIPFNADQLAAVSEFTKWLDEQQAGNFAKLQVKVTQKAQQLNLAGIKCVVIKKAELQAYMDQQQVDFAAALRRFAEDLGHYERVTAKLSFDDLKNAVLRKLQQVPDRTPEF